MEKIYNYTYKPGTSYVKSGFKGRWGIGDIVDKKTGAYIVGGGNGTFIIAIPAIIKIYFQNTASGDIKSLEIGNILRAHAHSLSRKLIPDFVEQLCDALIGKDFDYGTCEEDALENIRKLVKTL